MRSKRQDFLLVIPLVFSVFCFIFILAHRAISSLDIWLHLKAGEFILKNKIIPAYDIFSFTFSGRPWVDHEWLFQVVSYLVYHKWQAEGLILLQTYILVLSFLVLFFIGLRIAKSYLAAAILTVVAVYASSDRFTIRPEVFSLLFFALYLYFLRFYIEKRPLWVIIPLQVLWVNSHGYFLLGPLLVFLFIASEFLRRRINFWPAGWKEQFILTDPGYRRLKKVFLFSILACFLNPYGSKGALYPVSILQGVFSGHFQIFFRYIRELQPTFQLNTDAVIFYHLLAILCFLALRVNLNRLKIIDVALLLVFFPLGLTFRSIAFFCFVGYVIIISCLEPTSERLPGYFKLSGTPKKILACAIAIAFLSFVWIKINAIKSKSYYYDPDSHKFKSTLSGIDYRYYPRGAVNFALAHGIKGNMLNDLNSGAYIIGKAYPGRRVFIDGRTELYGPDFFRQYINALEGDSEVFESLLKQYNISAVLFSLVYKSPLSIISYIYRSAQWKLVFFDHSGVIFLKDNPENRELIARFEVDLSKYVVPVTEKWVKKIRRIYPWVYIRRGRLFRLLGREDLARRELEEALRIRPDCDEAKQMLREISSES
jgi:hypothetical protein